MKRCPYLLPLLVLAGLLLLSLWNSRHMTETTRALRDQVLLADRLASEGDWPGAAAALAEGYRDWSGHQTYLHIVLEHDAVDGAEAMYRRAAAFAATEEITEFRAEAADLLSQLRLLAEMERCSIKNVL